MKWRDVMRYTILSCLYDYRLVVLYAICVLLMGLAAPHSVTDLRQAKVHYEKLHAVAREKANLETVAVLKRPSPLAFLAEGQSKNLPAYLLVSASFVDYPLADVSKRPLLAGRPSLDWASVIGYLFSLVALLMSFDAVAGERERGTLRLIFSHHVSRATVLVGKWSGIMMVLVPVFLLSAIINLLIIATSGVINLTAEIMTVTGWVVGLTIIFLGAHVTIGLLASSLTPRASTALVICLLFWVIEVVLVPSGATLIGQLLAPVPDTTTYQMQLRSAQQRYDVNRPEISSLMIDEILDRPDLSDREKEEQLNKLQQTITRQQRQAYAAFHRELIRVREEYIHRLIRQLYMIEVLSALSPVSLYQSLLNSLAGTDFRNHELFYRAANQYRQIFARWAERMKRAIGSERTIKVKRVSMQEFDRAVSELGEVGIYERGYMLIIPRLSYKDVPIDKSTLPQFDYEGVSLNDKLHLILWRAAALVVLTIMTFVMAWIAFIRYRVA